MSGVLVFYHNPPKDDLKATRFLHACVRPASEPYIPTEDLQTRHFCRSRLYESTWMNSTQHDIVMAPRWVQQGGFGGPATYLLVTVLDSENITFKKTHMLVTWHTNTRVVVICFPITGKGVSAKDTLLNLSTQWLVQGNVTRVGGTILDVPLPIVLCGVVEEEGEVRITREEALSTCPQAINYYEVDPKRRSGFETFMEGVGGVAVGCPASEVKVAKSDKKPWEAPCSVM